MKFIILQLLLSCLFVGATEVDVLNLPVPDLKKGNGTTLLSFFKDFFKKFDVNPTAPEGRYDLIIIGAGPAGESLAIAAKRIKKDLNVAVIEKVETFGGPSGLVSKAVREVAQSIYQTVSALIPDLASKTRAEKLDLFKTIWQRDFKMLKDDAVNFQAVETMMKFKKHGVEVYVGEVTIKKPDGASPKIVVKVRSGNVEQELRSKDLCIATGSTPNRPATLNSVAIPWGHDRMLDSIKIGNLDQLPVSLGIIGGGVIAAEYGESCRIPL